MMTDAEREEECLRADALYHPCWCGIHVCGSSPEEAAMTVANIPARSPEEARQIFMACRQEAEAAPGEPGDYVVDLNLDRNNLHVEDFWLTRQMLKRCLAVGVAVRNNQANQ